MWLWSFMRHTTVMDVSNSTQNARRHSHFSAYPSKREEAINIKIINFLRDVGSSFDRTIQQSLFRGKKTHQMDNSFITEVKWSSVHETYLQNTVHV